MICPARTGPTATPRPSATDNPPKIDPMDFTPNIDAVTLGIITMAPAYEIPKNTENK